jgi:hypothetical protein
MANQYKRGYEPTCPVRGPRCAGVIRTRGGHACHACSRQAPAPPPPPPPVTIQEPPATVADAAGAVLARLKKGAASLEQLAQDVRGTPGQVLDALLGLQRGGVNVHAFGDVWSLEKAPDLGGGGTVHAYRSRPNGTYRFGWLGDTHLCSKYERLDVLRDIYRRFADADIDRIFHAGNWIDGEARFNKFDLLVHGMDAQVHYFGEQYPVAPKGLVTYSIAGDDHEGWYCQREGVDIGKYCENELRAMGRTDWVNLGYMEAFVPLEHAGTGKTQHLHLVHPGGGSSYATSYTVQKLVESYSGGSKPAVLLAGHYHKLEFLPVRNVWTIQTGCTQDQTPFARKKRLHYALGGGVCELEQDGETGAIVGCTVTMWTYYDRGFYNNRWSLSGPVALPDRGVGHGEAQRA